MLFIKFIKFIRDWVKNHFSGILVAVIAGLILWLITSNSLKETQDSTRGSKIDYDNPSLATAPEAATYIKKTNKLYEIGELKNLNPSELIKRIRSITTIQEREFLTGQLIGIWVKWQLRIVDMSLPDKKTKLVHLILEEDIKNALGVYILCDVSIEKFEFLKQAGEGDSCMVEGQIKKITRDGKIYLKYVGLEYMMI